MTHRTAFGAITALIMMLLFLLSASIVYSQNQILNHPTCPTCAIPAPKTWPTALEWIPYKDVNGNIITDTNDEQPSETDIHQDPVYSPACVLYVLRDSTLFIREQVESDPQGGGGFSQYEWLLEIYDNNTTPNHLATVGINGNPTGPHTALDNSYITTGDETWYSEIYHVLGTSNSPVFTNSGMSTESIPGTNNGGSLLHWYIDWQIPWCMINSFSCMYGDTLGRNLSGLNMNSQMRFQFGTGTTTGHINKDYAGVAGGGGALPVELTSFTLQLRNGEVSLRWSTATEANNHGFEIERSTVRGAWEVRGFVAGHGTSSTPNSYSFKDDAPVSNSGQVRYRLKQTDRDGKITYSQTLSLDLAPATNSSLDGIYPSPIVRGASRPTVTYTLDEESTITLDAYSPAGERVRLMNETLMPSGRHSMTCDMSQIHGSGTWYAVLTVNGSVQRIKSFMVLD